jgi:hypothetical protein
MDGDSKPHNIQKVDPRLDPYGARDFGKVAPSQEDNVRQWVENEKSIERIIREGSVQLLAAKCGSFATRPESYITAYESCVHNPR